METINVSAWENLQKLMKRHPLVCFFLLAFAFSWIITVPHLLSVWNIIEGDYAIVLYLKQWIGPAIAAIIMTRVTEGNMGQMGLRNRIRQWRVAWVWYGFILLGVPILALIGIMVQTGTLANFTALSPATLANYPLYFIGIFFGTGLPEEIGWRGFALPRMQKRYGPLGSSMILGSLWAFWHLLSFLLPAHGGGPGTGFSVMLANFFIFFLMVVAINIIFSWVYNHTQGSILIAALLHTAIDAPQLVWAPLFLDVGMSNSTAGEMGLNLAYLIAFGVFALLLLVFTRGRLGYRPETQPITQSGLLAPQ